MGLNTCSPIPLHFQLMNQLREEILKGELTERIPSERELMDRFSVSRSTVRQAISQLVLEGVLEKRHGKGTFVYHRPVEEWLGNISTYKKIINDMQMTPGTRLISSRVEHLQNIRSNSFDLGIFKQDKLYAIDRLQLANQIPIAIEKQYYPMEIGTKLAEYDLNEAVIYDLLELTLGINLWEAEQVVTSKIPTKEDANYLHIPQTASVLVTERVTYDTNNNLVEYLQGMFRADMYAFRIKLARSQNRG